MSRHTKAEENLIKFLKNAGFPEAAILLDPEFETPQGNIVARPDVVVVNRKSLDPVAIFEVKSKLEPKHEHRIVMQVGGYSDLFPNIPSYLVTFSEERPGFQLHYFNRSTRIFQDIAPEDLPTYDDLVVAAEGSKESEDRSSRKARERITYQLKLICWALAGMCAAIGVSDFIWPDKEILNGSRLAILGIVIGLVVLPFAQKLKLLGVEFERIRVIPADHD
jgi:hypothetical protein